MAEAKLVPEKKPDVQLTLTHDEAYSLCKMVNSIGGDVISTRRKHADNIAEALEKVGISSLSDEYMSIRSTGSITFQN